jgi:hypothetical protein
MTTHIQKSQQLSAYTKSITFCSLFYHIKPSKCLVFSVCPICYCLYPVSCVTFLSLIIFKIIPHPMTLLIAFPLQVIVSYFILHHLLLLTYHLITYLLPSSHILSSHINPTHRLKPSLVSSRISLHPSSELSSHILITPFILALVSCPCLHQKSLIFAYIRHPHSCPTSPSLFCCYLYYSAYSIAPSSPAPFYPRSLYVIVIDSKSRRIYILLLLSLQTFPHLLHFILQPS